MGYILLIRCGKEMTCFGFEVPHEVYCYVRQLEEYINDPEKSRLLEVYPARFAPALARKEVTKR